MRCRQVRKAGAIERRHQEVAGPAGAVAGEDAARAVGAVRSRREADDEDARVRIAETGNRTRPVRLVTIGPPFFAADLLAVLAQPRAALARNDRVANGYQTRHAFCRTMGASALHENAFANSGMFDTVPLTR